MGLIRTEIELVNAVDSGMAKRNLISEKEVRSVKVIALVDSGSYMMCINEAIRDQLGLDKVGEQEAELADGKRVVLEIAGPLDVCFQNRATSCRAMVLPGDAEVLLGAIPMEDLDVVIDPKRQEMLVNPKHPYMASKPVK